MARYRIILADDHEMLRQGLKGLLDQDPQFSVVAQAQDGEDLLEKLKKNKCEVAVLDLSMPNMDGIQALKVIKEKYPKVKVLVLTMQKDHEHFKHAISAGASGYLLKDEAFDQLSMAIRMIMRGKEFVSSSVAKLLTDRYIRSLDDNESPSLEILTKREMQILKCIVNGYANKKIAAKLNLSIRTIEAHRLNLTNKLGIKNTAGLVKFAISKGLA